LILFSSIPIPFLPLSYSALTPKPCHGFLEGSLYLLEIYEDIYFWMD
jgi:hypothetical protein